MTEFNNISKKSISLKTIAEAKHILDNAPLAAGVRYIWDSKDQKMKWVGISKEINKKKG